MEKDVHGADTVRRKPGKMRIWPMVAILMVINMFSHIDRNMTSILGEVVKRDLSLSDFQLGLLNGLAFMAIYAVAGVPLGWLADRWTPRLLLGIVLAIWSGMTALGGAATNFTQLALTRSGVALGEAGGVPASHSLIQYGVSAEFRGRALALFQIGGIAGSAIGLVAIGWLATFLNWRSIFIIAGGLGLLLPMALFATTRSVKVVATSAVRAKPLAVVQKLFGSPAFKWIFVSAIMLGAVAASTTTFLAPFFMRVHGMTTAQVGLALGATGLIAGLVAPAIGGVLFDRAQKNSAKLLMLVPAFCFIIGGISATAALLVPNSLYSVLLFVPLAFAGSFHYAITFGCAHMIAGPGAQAVTSSLLMLATTMVGGLGGPPLLGLLSDMLEPVHGVNALRWAMMVMPVAGVAAGVALLMAHRPVQHLFEQSASARRASN